MTAFEDLKGKKFNFLTVIRRSENKGKRTAWECKCQCGLICVIQSDKIKSGHTKSCGCLIVKKSKENGLKNKKHGMTNTPTWNTWQSMVYRCTKKDSRQYPIYGGMLCERWKKFDNFLSDMGIRPANKTLDRIDVKKGYSPENCRWASPSEQQNNKIKTRYLVIDGKKVPLMILASQLKIKKSAAQYFYSTALKLMKKYNYIPKPFLES